MAMSEQGKVRIEVSRDDIKELPPRDPRGRKPNTLIDPPDERNLLSEMFSAMQGEGKVHVYYQLPRGDAEYVGNFMADESVLDDIEGFIGKNYGGGTFRLRGTRKGVNIRPAITVLVSEKRFGPLRNFWKEEQERTRAAAVEGVTDAPGIHNHAPVGELEILRLRSEMEQRQLALQIEAQRRTEAMQLEAQKNMQNMFVMMLQMQENNSTRMVQALAGANGKGGVGEIATVANLLRDFGWGPSNEGGGSDQSPAMQVLSGAVNAFTAPLGAKLAEVVGKQMAPPPAPPRQLTAAPRPVTIPPLPQAPSAAAMPVPVPQSPTETAPPTIVKPKRKEDRFTVKRPTLYGNPPLAVPKDA